jgi:DNA helicase-2/ATP-dependent DNA helicase PcrA
MLDGLNDTQKKAVQAGDGPLLIVAGAGSGKTKTLTTRLAYLIAEKGVAPSRILAITFTNKAAKEMKERVATLLSTINNKTAGAPFLGTFHAFGAYMLRKEGRRVGRDASFTIYDRNDTTRVIKECIKKSSTTEGTLNPSKALKIISRIKSELLSEEEFWGNKKEEKYWTLYQAYEKELQAQNAFDFDDLIQKVVYIFSQHKEVLAKWQSKYDYILIDEYQDVNMAQYHMVRLLAQSHQNINVVGDDQQSIYKFRFSDFRNFLNFEKDWNHTNVVLLEQNYRSSSTIIDASSALIAHNINQKKKTLWTDNPKGEPIHIAEYDNEFAQADAMADIVDGQLQKGLVTGILFRTNAQSRALEHIFLERGVPYTLFGALSFYERKEIKDLVAALRIALNPKDKVSIQRLENVLYKKRTKALQEGLATYAKEYAPAELLEWIIKSTDYLHIVERSMNKTQERLENISELMYFASQFGDLGTFMEQIALASPFDSMQKRAKKSADDTGAHMMTIHLAKGLEFDVVHVAGVNEGLIPHQQSLFSQEEIEEERRLMYVAMTRAKKELYLHWYDIPSRFLSEIPGDCVDIQGGMPLEDEEHYIEYD